MKCKHPNWIYRRNDKERTCEDCRFVEVKTEIWIAVPEGCKVEWSE